MWAGSSPFADITTTHEILSLLKTGVSLQLTPPNTGLHWDDLYKLLQSCWNLNPDLRPPMEQVYKTLVEIKKKIVPQHEYLHHE
jgi:hypothetical protein